MILVRGSLCGFFSPRRSDPLAHSRASTSEHLLRLFDAMSDATELSFDPDKLTGIRVHNFNPDEDIEPAAARFFSPWSTEMLNRYPKNMMDEEAQRLEAQTKRILMHPNLGLDVPPSEDLIWARTSFLSSCLMTEVEMVPRVGTKEDNRFLRSVTRWRHHE
jgi:hypothetical protein